MSRSEPETMFCHDSEMILAGRRLLNVGVLLRLVGDIQALCPVGSPGAVSPDLITVPRKTTERGTCLQDTGSSAGIED